MTPSGPRSDAELASRIRTSDKAAFKSLYYRYQNALFRFLCRRVQSEELAKDLLQEIFYRLWKKRENLSSKKSIRAYLFEIGNNLVIDYFRKLDTERTYRASSADGNLAHVENDDFELRERAQAVIQSLPEPLRVVFMFSRFEGYKYREIAEILDISPKTVEARLSKALAILREKLAPFLSATVFFEVF